MAFGITAFSQAAIASLGGGIANANGQNINTSQGNVTVDLNTVVNVTGQSITSTQGNVSISSGDSVILTGINLTNSLNSVSTTGTGKVTVTGQELAISNKISVQGTLKAFAELPFATQSSRFIQTGNVTVSIDNNTSVTGEVLSISEGSVTTVANADVIPTGIELAIQENAPTVTGDAKVDLTGNALTSNLGTAVLNANTIASPSGQELTMQEGQADATDSIARLTGIEMSVAQGNARTLIWIPVDPGVGTTWNNVSTGSSSTYTNVDTGTKPGWTEVDTAA